MARHHETTAYRALDLAVRQRCLQIKMPIRDGIIGRWFGLEEPARWQELLDCTSIPTVEDLRPLLEAFDRTGLGTMNVQIFANGEAAVEFIEAKRSTLDHKAKIVAKKEKLKAEEPPQKVDSPISICLEKVLPAELDALAVQYLEQMDLEPTLAARASLFGESEHLWDRYVNHGESFGPNVIRRWMRSWDSSTGRTLQIQEQKPREYSIGHISSESSRVVSAVDWDAEDFVEYLPPLELIGRGSARMVYRYGEGHVLKVPRSLQGIVANRREAAMYLDELERFERAGIDPREIGFARCELVHTDEAEDLLLMEWVSKSRHGAHRRQKHLRNVERGQYGVTLDGRTVRFDYGG